MIHTVGPIWQGGGAAETELLRSAYWNSLALGKAHGVRTIAFPSISTGAYRFPIALAAPIAISAVRDFALEQGHYSEIRFILHTEGDLQVYRAAMERS